MKSQILSDTTKGAKQIAIDAAKKMAREPLEILKNASETLTSPAAVNVKNYQIGEKRPDILDQQKQEENMKKDLRIVQALENEMKDINRNKLIEEIQKKISLGEAVYFENYPELPPEQIDILKKQQWEVEEGRKQKANSKDGGVPGPAPKRSRRFGFSKKQAAERESTKTEKPMPPSG